MKIFFITRGFPSESNLMLGNYESVQARALAKMGHEVVNICAPSIYKSELHLFDKNRLSYREVDGVKVYERIGFFPFILAKYYHPLWISQFFAKIAYHYLIRKVLEIEGKPDLVHIHILYVAYFAVFSKSLKTIPIVITEHWSQLKDSDNNDITWMSAAYSKADALIAVSKSLAQVVERVSGKPVFVVNNMVEDRFWNDVKPVASDGKFHFITVGRLCDDKHYDMLICSFSKCNFSSDTVLDIVGNGENFEALESQIDDEGLKRKVILHGEKSSDEVAMMLASSDCFVLSSRVETFGIVLIEAMAKGLPVIATRCGGPEEFVTAEAGVLVPNDDCESLASAMKRMRMEAKNYNKKKIQNYCYENFSQKAIGVKIVEVYKHVLNK
jgi:glycosyltransferase involved in cell wall biosynthesis